MTDPADIEWMVTRLTPHPTGTFTTPVRLGNPTAGDIQRTFVSCLPYPPGGLIPIFAEQVRNDPSWDYREINASHDPMVTDPETLAELFLEIAGAVNPAGPGNSV